MRRSGALGRWHELVDDALKPYVLTAPDLSLKEHNWLTGAAIIAWVLATVALAGPTWERLPVPAYRSSEALVVALDLSRSMDAGDLQPTPTQPLGLWLSWPVVRRQWPRAVHFLCVPR